MSEKTFVHMSYNSQKYQKAQSEVVAIQHRLARCQNTTTVIEKELRIAQQQQNLTR